MNAAILAVYYGWIDGINDLMNTPRIGYERHGPLGGVAATLIALTNSLLKPLVGTLSSITWFCRGVYASVHNPVLDDNDEETSAANTLGLNSSALDMTCDDEEQQYDDNISQVAVEAAATTGFKPAVCKRILFEFDEIKRQQVDMHPHEHIS
jgi:hypothetical protein